MFFANFLDFIPLGDSFDLNKEQSIVLLRTKG